MIAGQTCVAPDYLLVHDSFVDPLIEHIEEAVKHFFGGDPAANADYPRIVNAAHFERLSGLLDRGRIRFGGKCDAADRYIAPTVIDRVGLDDPVMVEEIFGPILPVLTFSSLDAAVETVNKRPKPLSLYYFGKSANRRDRGVGELSFGGGCVNDTLLHLANPHLLFSGVGPSGMGSYHGRAGCDAFSHRKSIMKRTFFPDAPVHYPPFSRWKMRLIRRLLK